jgi:hypothetical protein
MSVTTILFHGNCLDGWFGTYISYNYLKTFSQVKMYPISPNQRNTWPDIKEMVGTNVLLVDVSIEESIRNEWLSKGVLAIDCIDHHASAIAHWPINPDGTSTVIDTTRCAALQAWMRFFSMLPIPGWLQQIDRIDRWENPTYEDRCLREVLNVIAHYPVQKKIPEAIQHSDQFLQMYSNPIELQQLMVSGKDILDKKDAALFETLQNGQVVQITHQHLSQWALPATWLNKTTFIIDNSFNPFDTTEAAHIIFCHMPHIDVFINYRRKGFRDRVTKEDKTMYVYSARGRGFDITDGTILRGHPSSAGASLTEGDATVFPFVAQLSI